MADLLDWLGLKPGALNQPQSPNLFGVAPPVAGVPESYVPGYQLPPKPWAQPNNALDRGWGFAKSLVPKEARQAYGSVAGLIGEMSPGADVRDMLEYSQSSWDNLRSGQYAKALQDVGWTGLATAGLLVPGNVSAMRKAGEDVTDAISGIRLKAKPPLEDINEVANANFTHSKVVGNKTMPIEKLTGGAAENQPAEITRVADLANKIKENGYITRLIIDQHGNVIEGQHRLSALKKLGVENVPVSVIEDLEGGLDVGAMKDAILKIGKIHPDSAHYLMKNVLEMISESGGDPRKVAQIFDLSSPPEWRGHVEAALEAAVRKKK